MRSRLFHTIVVLGTSLTTACGGSDSTGTTPPTDAATDASKDGIGSDGSDAGADTSDTFPTIKPPSDTGSSVDTSTTSDTATGTDTFPGIKPPPPPDDAFPAIK